MSNLAPGTVQFGLPYDIDNQIGQMSYEKVNRIIGPARSNRIDTLDTAIAYGQIEACIGQIGVRGFYVTIKLPALPESFMNVSRSVREQILASLRRLNMIAVYGLLLHRSQYE